MEQETMGTIKFYEDKIVTKKDGVVSTWSKFLGDHTNYINYNDINWKLKDTKKES